MKQGEVATFAFIEPMKALRVQELPVGDWLYELKFNGYRALAFKAGKEVRLISRNRTNFDNDYHTRMPVILPEEESCNTLARSVIKINCISSITKPECDLVRFGGGPWLKE